MRSFSFCPQEIAEKCSKERSWEHVHVCIKSPSGRDIKPACGSRFITLAFHDLDPEAILRTEAFKNDPVKGTNIIDHCMNEAQAREIAAFVGKTSPLDVVVNCEAGISRSPGVVLAFLRAHGGDTEAVFRRAHPNIHVANLMGRVLGVGPFKAPAVEPGKIIITDLFTD